MRCILLCSSITSRWADSLLFPSYATVLSVIVLFGQVLFARLRQREKVPQDPRGRQDDYDAQEDASSRLRRLIAKHGGVVIFGFQVVRLLACLALALLSIHLATLYGWYSGRDDTPHEALAISHVRRSHLTCNTHSSISHRHTSAFWHSLPQLRRTSGVT